jgi:hypothetical protein
MWKKYCFSIPEEKRIKEEPAKLNRGVALRAL